MFYLKKNQVPICIVNVCILLFFTILFIRRRNYEFILYIGVILFFLLIILLTNKKVQYSNFLLWGLTLWGFMHLAGGGLYIKGIKLYEYILFPLSELYHIFKYDQLVHIIGFGVSTLIMYHLIKPHLKQTSEKVALSIVVVMAGLGVGALNEIIEFFVTVIVPETGVGGYANTSLDLVSDLIGACIALIIIRVVPNVRSKH